jgi:hypothetical protein
MKRYPSDLPYWVTVYHYFRQWRKNGLWQKINDILRERVREKLGRDNNPVLVFSIVNPSKPVKRVGCVVTMVPRKSKDENDIC